MHQQQFTSTQRSTGETSADFHNIFNPPLNVIGKKLVFRMLQISNSVYNVGTGTIIDVVNGGGVSTPVTLTPGLYSLTSGASMLQDAINTALGATLSPPDNTVTVDSNTAKITFTFTAPMTLKFLTGVSKSSLNLAWKLLGFTAADGLTAVDSSTGASITSVYACAFGMPMSLYLNVALDDNPTRPIEIGAGNLNRRCSMIVPLVVGRGTMTKLTQGEMSLVIFPQQDFVKSAHLTVTDETGRTLDLNNADWWILFDIVDKELPAYPRV